VLDLVRDFDPETGFNVRLLQWWGHGLYFFVQIGPGNPRMPALLAQKLSGFFVSDHPDPWDYPKMLSTKKKMEDLARLDTTPKGQLFQIFKEIQLSEDPNKLLNHLKREILLIMDYRH
jgi:hypothetical protein